MTWREVFCEDELRTMLHLAVDHARRTTRENMSDEAIVDWAVRRHAGRGGKVVEVSGPPSMETR